MDQKLELVVRAGMGEPVRALCREYGVSPKTAHKWLGRYAAGGAAALEERSRRPAGHPAALDARVACELVGLKVAHPHWGPRKIGALYRRKHGSGPSDSSVGRVLERAGLVEPRRRRKPPQAGRLSGGRRAAEPNAVWTVDFKGWWRARDGRRLEPLTVRDEFSRFLLALRILPDARGGTVRAAFERLFERHGLPGAIRSDNGAPFACSGAPWGLSRLSAWWLALGVDLERGRPAHPQDNGAHERLHRDVARELEARPSPACDQAALDLWREEFNAERPHGALGMRTPADLYRASARRFAPGPVTLEYPGMAARRVNPIGRIGWEGAQVFLSKALSGWDVGLRPEAGGRGTLEAFFGRLRLGVLDPARAAFLRADVGPQTAARAPVDAEQETETETE